MKDPKVDRNVLKNIAACGELLRERKLTVAFAESATSGAVTALFSLIPEAGDFLIGGIVCYDARVKTSLLDVPEHLLTQFTPESFEVTRSLVFGLKKVMTADVYVAVTGLTRPGGSESKEKPVGSMFFYFLHKEREAGFREVFKGGEEEIIIQSGEFIARALCEFLLK